MSLCIDAFLLCLLKTVSSLPYLAGSNYLLSPTSLNYFRTWPGVLRSKPRLPRSPLPTPPLPCEHTPAWIVARCVCRRRPWHASIVHRRASRGHSAPGDNCDAPLHGDGGERAALAAQSSRLFGGGWRMGALF